MVILSHDHLSTMITRQALLLVCLIHLCFAEELFEEMSINGESLQRYALRDYGIDPNRIESKSLMLWLPCCGTTSIFLSQTINGSQSTPIQIDIFSPTSKDDFVEIVGEKNFFTGSIECTNPDMLMLNWTTLGNVSFGIADQPEFFNRHLFDRIESLNIAVISSTCLTTGCGGCRLQPLWRFKISTCSDGMYGESCNLKCGHCLNETCARFTGECPNGCDLGWRGVYCTEVCSDGMYGESCNLNCGHCRNETCDRFTGECPNGCNLGWKGVYCTEDPCLNHACYNEGICYHNDSVTACYCTAKYKGLQCETYNSPCSVSPCQNGGTCYDNLGTAVCICDTLYSGEYCGQSVDPCSLSPCNNGGTCDNSTDDATCRCTSRFTGTYCETYVTPCDSSPCLHGGTCYDHIGFAVCICETQYTGLNCETDIDPCNTTICHNGGVCEEIDGRAVCNCFSRYTGTYCEQYVTPCDSSPCLHGGTCYDHIGFAVCICETQYTGLNCETYVNPCIGPVCHNEGTCDDINGTAVCSCTRQFTGTFCESCSDPCKTLQCQNNGKCNILDGNATCRCNGRHTGPQCESPVSTIESVSYKIDKTTLSSYKRKRTSASDTRRSAMYLGVGGVSLITVVVLIIVSLDCLPNPRKK